MSKLIGFRTSEYFEGILIRFQKFIHKGKRVAMLNDLLARGIEATIEDEARLFALAKINEKYRKRLSYIDEAKAFFNIEEFEEIKKEYIHLIDDQRIFLEDKIGYVPLAGWLGPVTFTPDGGDAYDQEQALKDEIAGNNSAE